MLHQVFVYGTLRRGETHHDLLTDAVLLGLHRTEPAYTMLDLGAYPGVVAGGHGKILGEVYRVNSQALRRLDRLEDYPRLFDRRLIKCRYGRAWMYLYRGDGRERRRVTSGDWKKRDTLGA
jgi:gamma-glutamylcyclotransferase (GGCT)/AIG2-like uncharacterized protein YtfP